MKTAAGVLFLFFLISISSLVLNEGPVHAGRVFKRNSISAQTHKDRSHHPNLLIQEVDVAPSGPNPGGNKNTQSISQGLNYVHDDKPSIQFQKGHVAPCGRHNQRLSSVVDGDHELGDILNDKLPSGPSPGVGHKYINSFGPLKMNTRNTAISAATAKTLKVNKLPSGPSGGVGHRYSPLDTNKASMLTAERLVTTSFNKLSSGPSEGVGHKYVD